MLKVRGDQQCKPWNIIDQSGSIKLCNDTNISHWLVPTECRVRFRVPTLWWYEDHPTGHPAGVKGGAGVGGGVPVTFTLLQMYGRSEWHF